MPLGVLTTGALGWISVAKRWRIHLPPKLGYEPKYFEIQDFEFWEARMPVVSRHAWLRAALRGRRAIKAALAAGCDQLLICTIADVPLAPKGARARYMVYGDATPRQLDALYYNDHADSLRKRWLRKGVSRLAREGHRFLCMSNWYREGVMREYGVPPANAIFLPPAVDLDLWRPREKETPRLPLRAVFVGGDFERKGGDVVLELAQRISPERVGWDVVTASSHPAEGHVRFHTGLQPDSQALVERVREADLMVFPTRADCSPNALLEAGAAGLALISTDVGGISDMVVDRLNGRLLRSADVDLFQEALQPYIENPELAAQQGREARAKVADENSIGRHVDVLLASMA